MDQEFVNLYIEKVFVRLADLTKQDLLLTTQLEFAQRQVEALRKENDILKGQLLELAMKMGTEEPPKETKKRKSQTEVNTSGEF